MVAIIICCSCLLVVCICTIGSSSSWLRNWRYYVCRRYSENCNGSCCQLNVLDEEVDEADCVICLSKIKVSQGESLLRLLPSCNHSFHADCIVTWLRAHSTCPLCRATVTLAAGAGVGVLLNPSPPPGHHHQHHHATPGDRGVFSAGLASFFAIKKWLGKNPPIRSVLTWALCESLCYL